MSTTQSDVEQIYSDNPGSIPAEYPFVSDVGIQSVVARIDGSGAASAFLPTLSIYSQDLKLIARVPSDITYEVGDTGVVTWSPFLARRIRPSGGYTQVYSGQATAADFTFNSAAYVASGFPVNSTFTKLTSTSLLDICLTADFTTNLTAPNTLYAALFIDGTLEEAAGVTVGRATSFVTAAWRKVRGIGNTSLPPLTSGAHTLEVKVAQDLGASNSTLRSSTSVDLEILEFEPPA